MSTDNYTPKQARGYQQLTVSTSAVSLTVPGGGVNNCEIVVSTDNVRWRDDGTDPSSSVGMPLLASATTQATLSYDGQPEDLRFIRSGAADAVLNISYYAA